LPLSDRSRRSYNPPVFIPWEIQELQMKKVLKWVGIVLGVLLGVLILALAVFYFKGNALANRKYDISPESVVIPTDAASIERGRHFVQAICVGCHTADLSGHLLLDAPFAKVYSANLTPGKGGAGAEFTDADFVRAIRHGVDNKGRALVIMPAQEFWNFSDADLADIVAYLRSLPPVDNQQPDPQITPVGKILLGGGIIPGDLIPASVIAHDQRPPVVPAGVTPQYGEYLVNVTGCHGCHGPQLAGGKSQKPGAIDAPNLTAGGDLSAWKEADFNKTIRTGVTPTGRVLNPDEMPWKDFNGNYSDEELAAIFAYLKTLPALATVKP
jgi:mono/diheme cytochrome c family protein